MKICKKAMVCVALAASSSFSFADWKGYSGLNCLPANENNDIRRSLTGLANEQDSPLSLYCPVVRDIESGGVNRIERVNVRVFNNNSSEGGYCRVYSRTVNGTTHDWEQQSWPAGYGDHTLTFESLNTANWGNIAIYCRLPAAEGARRSFLRSYGVEEQ